MDRPLVADLPTRRVKTSRRAVHEIGELEARLGYSFEEPELLERALTHVTGAPAEAQRLLSYQRLEFLGDRVLGLVVSDMLFREFPDAQEGELSQRLAHLVRRETCADVASVWGLGPFIRLGPGEAQTGGRKKQAILADVCEAVIGAVFIDGGLPAAQSLIRGEWLRRMLAPTRPLCDAKTALQEWAQARGLPAPAYSVVERTGPHHAPQFLMRVDVSGFTSAEARGASKRLAEQSAAQAFIDREEISPARSPSP